MTSLSSLPARGRSSPICRRRRLPSIHSAHSEETLRIRAYIESHRPRSAVVVGGGFIGLEGAENLLHAGVATTLLQRSGQVLPPLDWDMAQEVHSYLRGQGLDLRLNAGVQGFQEMDGQFYTLVKDSAPIPSDLVLLAIGVTPESDLAREAGLTLGAKGAIVVNEHMVTSDPDIYAVGDAVELTHFVSGSKALIALAGPANRQGRIAADHICGPGEPLCRGTGLLYHQAVPHDGRLHRSERKGRPGRWHPL